MRPCKMASDTSSTDTMDTKKLDSQQKKVYMFFNIDISEKVRNENFNSRNMIKATVPNLNLPSSLVPRQPRNLGGGLRTAGNPINRRSSLITQPNKFYMSRHSKLRVPNTSDYYEQCNDTYMPDSNKSMSLYNNQYSREQGNYARYNQHQPCEYSYYQQVPRYEPRRQPNYQTKNRNCTYKTFDDIPQRHHSIKYFDDQGQQFYPKNNNKCGTETQNSRCYFHGNDPSKGFTVEHIIPIELDEHNELKCQAPPNSVFFEKSLSNFCNKHPRNSSGAANPYTQDQCYQNCATLPNAFQNEDSVCVLEHMPVPGNMTYPISYWDNNNLYCNDPIETQLQKIQMSDCNTNRPTQNHSLVCKKSVEFAIETGNQQNDEIPRKRPVTKWTTCNENKPNVQHSNWEIPYKQQQRKNGEPPSTKTRSGCDCYFIGNKNNSDSYLQCNIPTETLMDSSSSEFYSRTSICSNQAMLSSLATPPSRREFKAACQEPQAKRMNSKINEGYEKSRLNLQRSRVLCTKYRQPVQLNPNNEATYKKTDLNTDCTKPKCLMYPTKFRKKTIAFVDPNKNSSQYTMFFGPSQSVISKKSCIIQPDAEICKSNSTTSRVAEKVQTCIKSDVRSHDSNCCCCGERLQEQTVENDYTNKPTSACSLKKQKILRINSNTNCNQKDIDSSNPNLNSKYNNSLTSLREKTSSNKISYCAHCLQLIQQKKDSDVCFSDCPKPMQCPQLLYQKKDLDTCSSACPKPSQSSQLLQQKKDLDICFSACPKPKQMGQNSSVRCSSGATNNQSTGQIRNISTNICGTAKSFQFQQGNNSNAGIYYKPRPCISTKQMSNACSSKKPLVEELKQELLEQLRSNERRTAELQSLGPFPHSSLSPCIPERTNNAIGQNTSFGNNNMNLVWLPNESTYHFQQR